MERSFVNRGEGVSRNPGMDSGMEAGLENTSEGVRFRRGSMESLWG